MFRVDSAIGFELSTRGCRDGFMGCDAMATNLWEESCDEVKASILAGKDREDRENNLFSLSRPATPIGKRKNQGLSRRTGRIEFGRRDDIHDIEETSL